MLCMQDLVPTSVTTISFELSDHTVTQTTGKTPTRSPVSISFFYPTEGEQLLAAIAFSNKQFAYHYAGCCCRSKASLHSCFAHLLGSRQSERECCSNMHVCIMHRGQSQAAMGDDDERSKLLQPGLHFPAVTACWQGLPGSVANTAASTTRQIQGSQAAARCKVQTNLGLMALYSMGAHLLFMGIGYATSHL